MTHGSRGIADKRHLKMMVAGGCHITGYPVGNEIGFLAVSLRWLGDLVVEVVLESYINLSSTERIVDKYREHLPDVLILQLGHYETLKTVRRGALRRVRSALRLGSRMEAGEQRSRYPYFTVREWCPEPNATFDPGLRWRLEKPVRVAIDYVLGHPLVSLDGVAERVEELFAMVKAHQMGHVVVLSPFPCADPVALHYRTKIGAILGSASSRFGFCFVDVVRVAQSPPQRGSLFADHAHLSAAGHQMIGEALGHHISGILSGGSRVLPNSGLPDMGSRQLANGPRKHATSRTAR